MNIKTTTALALFPIILLAFISMREQGNHTISDQLQPKTNYKTVQIGDQVWMAESLDVTRYRNGDALPQITDPEKWRKLTTGAWCYYNNDPKNGKKYGKLYNWYAVHDPRGLAPAGWHVADRCDWDKLAIHLGGHEIAAGKMKDKDQWKSTGFKYDNSSGFTSRPGGGRYNNRYLSMNSNANYWTDADSSETQAFARFISVGSNSLFESEYAKHWGFSVRCVKD